VEEKISELEDDKLQRENADYRNLLTEYREGILLFSIMEQEVWNKASDDTVGQRKYYEQNLSKYRAGERVHARVLGAADKNTRDELKSKISRGDTLTEGDLKRLRIVQRPRPYERGENKAIDQVPWAVGLHEAEADGMYYLVEVDRLVPAGNKTFQEARPRVISDYQDELEQRWLRELRAKYPVKVNKKAVKLVIANLQKK
jgi:peptidyl-prolyl cis-trans isomerase SurA